MKIAMTIDFAATPAAVFAMLSSEAFQDLKCAATGAVSHDVSVTVERAQTVILTRRVMPTDGFPDFVRSMVGATIVVTQTDTWGPGSPDGSREGRLAVEVSGAPIGMTGTLRLAPGGPGCIESVDGDLKAHIPLLGGRIEKAAAPAVEAGIKVERRTGAAWLSEHA